MFRKTTLILVLLALFLVIPVKTLALYQPWIAEQEARKAYQEKLVTYSNEDQKKITALADLIVQINKQKGLQMSQQMEAQAALLDEYEKRHSSDPKIENARYWLTYAHEAVAFQEAKNYIFSLSSEKNIKGDVTPTINQLKGDLETTRAKVLKSQGIVQELVR